MIEFAVQVASEDKGRWVLSVDGDRLLIADDEQRLKWVDMAVCKVIKAVNPEIPRPVVIAQPTPAAPKLAVPHLQVTNGRGVQR